jgi:N-acetylglucosamine kinase-like BadF-type ATPase
MSILIADIGSTKCEWCLVDGRKQFTYFTQGMSPYFLTAEQMDGVIRNELLGQMKKKTPDEVHFYGTGNKNPENAKRTKKVLQKIFARAKVTVDLDLLAAARALCHDDPGIACILGTGSNSCYYNGKKMVRNIPGLGYVLGDEGSGAYLGKKVIQYYLYDVFEADLKQKFESKYKTDDSEILENVYHKPLPNRYLAGFARFLGENRGHYMVENIIEDGLNDFFFHHVAAYRESQKYPVHFTGSIAYNFSDVILKLCAWYGFEPGNILKNPMEGLVEYYRR